MGQSSSSSFSASGGAVRIAVVSAGWHADIVQQAARGFEQRIGQLIAGAQVVHFGVPGAFEIPLRAKLLAQSGDFDAIVACGLVVDGGIYRHDFVATAVINGLMRVQLDTLVPVFSVVLTPHHFHDHAEHQRFFHQHFLQKGQEAAQAVHEVLRAQDVGSDAAEEAEEASTRVPGVWTVRGG